MDIRRFYETCPHWVVMKGLNRIFKDKQFLYVAVLILANMSDTGVGLAIGHPSSHWFANVAIMEIDHELKRRHPDVKFTRYMDNFGIVGKNKRHTRKAMLFVMESIEKDEPYSGTEKTIMKLGVHVLPKFIRDTTDRNRTSPFAFTGNKFEFRMLGSANSIACCNIMLNAAVAESLRQYADALEGAEDFDSALHQLIQSVIKKHKRIIFNGNGYDDAWIKEATEQRGLLNLKTTPDALSVLLDKKNVDMLTAHKVFSEAELRSRYEIQLDNYCKTVRIEALTMVDMARKEILPAVEEYVSDLATAAAAKRAISAELSCGYEKKLLHRLTSLVDTMDGRVDALEEQLVRLDTLRSAGEEAAFIRDELIPAMGELRAVADESETQTAAGYWPFPTYGDLLFGVK